MRTQQETVVRRFEERDLQRIVEIYGKAFAEPPWNEFRKCASCNVNYGTDEVTEWYVYDRIGAKWEYELLIGRDDCKSCGVDLSPRIRQIPGGAYGFTNDNLVEFWPRSAILGDLDFARSQRSPLILVAERGGEVVGFTWGYEVPFAQFPFLTGRVREGTVYMDEIAVEPAARQRGVGRALCNGFFQESLNGGSFEVVLRTNENNTASMNMFNSAGLENIGKVDRKYPDRPYFKGRLEDILRR